MLHSYRLSKCGEIIFFLQKTRVKFFFHLAAGLITWNSLPDSLRDVMLSNDKLRAALKTHFLSKYQVVHKSLLGMSSKDIIGFFDLAK